MRWYVGPWQWNDSNPSVPYWAAPDGAVGALDLRSIPQQSVGTVQDGFGIFASKDELSSDYELLGTGSLRDVKASQRLNDRIPKRDRKRQPKGDDLLSLLLDAICDGSDPTGDSFAKPLMPDDQMRLCLSVAGLSHQWKTAPWNYHWDKIQDVERADFQRCFDETKAGKTKDREHHRRVLDALCDKYNLQGADDWKGFVPAKLRKEIPGRLKHETTITDDFTRANGATIGNLLTWTDLDGNLTTVSNRVNGTTGLDVSRAESDLSTADMSSQIVAVNAVNAVYGVLARHSSSVKTGYYGNVYQNTNSWRIFKRSAGTFTLLFSATNTLTAGDLVVLICNGSTVDILQNTTSRVSGTDTAITGNLRAGLIASVEPSTPQLDDFSASDYVSATVTYTRLEKLVRGVNRGVYTQSGG